MKAGAGVLIVGLFAALPAVAWQTAPNTVPGAAPAQPETASSATPSDTPAAKPCSAASIRAATAEKVAPALTGCNLALVAPPLLQFFHLVPTTTQAADKALPGTILSQKPAAGAALSPGGHLALAVS
ncbi:MAG: hypothetical protein JF615_15435, partial [Asticcacaulis sp.]|nr:hypothetical protein [Asticcacaulis sp.]